MELISSENTGAKAIACPPAEYMALEQLAARGGDCSWVVIGSQDVIVPEVVSAGWTDDDMMDRMQQGCEISRQKNRK